jgi:HD-like signal output (HDOD) protein
MTSPAAPIAQPLRDLDAWVRHFCAAEIPVLAETAETLQALAANEDAVDAHLLAETINGDPLMTLRLLAHVSTHARRMTDVETVTSALVLLGISPFFRAFSSLATMEERLQDQPDALQGLQAVLTRAHRGANFALGFAVHRMDHDAPVIHEAALLHDFAEMLLWCHAPVLATEIARRQRADASLRSAVVQREVLGIELADLQQALMKAWRLPELLIQLGDGRHTESPPVRNVLLAVRLARHTARGWDNAALPDDLRDVGELLRLGSEPTLKLLHQIDN